MDKAKDVAQTCGITAMPTFQFFKDGKKVDEVKGADVQQLNTKIGYYTAAVPKDAAQTPTAGSSKAAGSGSASSGSGSLRSLIDIEASKLLNTSMLSNIRNVISPPPAGYALASATNQAQFLLHIVFTQAVSPSQLKIKIAKDSHTNAPARLQVGSNVPIRISKTPEGVETNDLSMDSINKAENTQAINVFSDEYNNGVTELKLKASKFSGIKTLTIRIDSNLSGDSKTITKIGEMDIIGSKA